MGRQQRTERGLDRVVNFSDAVVAIAITLLVLPLTDLDTSADGTGAWDLVNQNLGAFGAFFLTFFLIALNWLNHHRTWEHLNDYTVPLVWLNMGWLMVIVLLPFTSGLVSTQGFGGGTGALYLYLLGAASALLALMGRYAARHTELLAPGVVSAELTSFRPWAYAGFFLINGTFSIWFPSAASYAMFLLVPLAIAFRRD